MKFLVTCTECGKEEKHFFGTGKEAKRNYEREKDTYMCESCYQEWKEKRRQEELKVEAETKLANGWEWKSVHYSDWKNTYENMRDADGKRIRKGEYHPDTKHIDILVPPSLVAKYFTEEVTDETKEETAPLASENKNEWHQISVEDSHIGRRSRKTIEITMPLDSKYAGYSFRHPLKCFREYNDGTQAISFSGDWKFTLRASGGALQCELSAAQMLEFACDLGMAEGKPELYEPLPVPPVENPEPLKELVDNE